MSNIRMGKIWSHFDHSVAGEFQNLMISQAFYTQQSVEFTQNGAKNKKHPVNWSFVGKSALLLTDDWKAT